MAGRPTQVAAAALFTLAALPSFAQTADEDLARRHPLAGRVSELVLENGWTFLFVARPGAPVIACETLVPVGSADEAPGETGLAHLFEHLAFKGSDRIGTRDAASERDALAAVDAAAAELARSRGEPTDEAALASARLAFEEARAHARSFVVDGEYARLFEEAGGARSLSATTGVDETRFVVTLPVNRFETWCWLESERFARPVLREFYEERDAVLEERRLRIDDNPFGALLATLQEAAFGGGPYAHPSLGRANDVHGWTRESARAFHQRHYGARGVVSVIVGAVDPDALAPLVQRYFGPLPPGPARAPGRIVEAGWSPAPAQQRLHVPFTGTRMVALAWAVPAGTNERSPALELAVRILGHARSSRLERDLVRGRGLLERVIVTPRWPGDRRETLALVVALPAPGIALETVAEAILAHVAALAESGPSAEELDAARGVARAERLREMHDPERLAARLAEAHSESGDWRAAFRYLDDMAALSATDVRDACRAFLTPDEALIATLGAERERIAPKEESR